MDTRVICISRSLYAGADEVAAQVAQQLGFRCVDEEIIARAARQLNVDPGELTQVEQRKSFLARLFEDLAQGAGMAGYGHGGEILTTEAIPVNSDSLRRLIREAIVETASQGEVVIVAHAASYALGARPDVLRVMITGSAAARAARRSAADGSQPAAAAEAIRLSDLARADYLKRFYQVEREQFAHYDVALSTDMLTPQQAAAIIVGAARAR